MILYYIRHGDPIYEPDSLTELGRRQAEAVGKRLALHGIDKIFSSPSNRAYCTAKPLAEICKKKIKKVDFLLEDNAWKFFSLSSGNDGNHWGFHLPKYRYIFAQDEVQRLGDRWYEHPDLKEHNFKEGVEFFNKNIDEFMLSMGYSHDRKTHSYKALNPNSDRIAVFAHEGIGSVFLSSVLDIPYPIFASRYAMNHSGVTVIKFDESGTDIIPSLIQMGSDSHLYKEGLPTKHCNNFFV